MSAPLLRIGVSACFMHADPTRALFKDKTLLYAEEAMLAWIMAGGAVPLMLPRAHGAVRVADLVEGLDGLVLQGGADVAPESYGESPIRPEWSGDRERDVYEIALIHACIAWKIPVLGICRGAQILNVALGGTLWQDIETQHPGHRIHRDWNVYDLNVHQISIEPDSTLSRWYGGATSGQINSVHHQGLKDLGRDLVIEARSVPDGVIEAVRHAPDSNDGCFVYGVQWHPEFMNASGGAAGLDPKVLLRAFLAAAQARQ